MQRIRLSGNESYGIKTVNCCKCTINIIHQGNPCTPIYFQDEDLKTYCGKCSAEVIESRKVTPKTYREWEDLAKTMTDNDKNEYIAALDTLKAWPEFTRAFNWTRIYDVRDILYYSQF